MLEMLANFASQALPFVQAGSSIYGAIKGAGGGGAIAEASNPQATEAEKRASAIYKALSDPNSPLLKQMQESEYKNIADTFLTQLRQMQMADRRSANMGRRSNFFNPERSDEAVDYLTSRAAGGIQQQGRAQAISRITGSASGYSGLVDQQVNRYNQGLSTRAAAEDMGGGNNIATSILQAIQGLNAPQQRGITNPWSEPKTNEIAWRYN